MAREDYRGGTYDRYEVSCEECESVIDYRVSKVSAIELANAHHDGEQGSFPHVARVYDRMARGGTREVYRV